MPCFSGEEMWHSVVECLSPGFDFDEQLCLKCHFCIFDASKECGKLVCVCFCYETGCHDDVLKIVDNLYMFSSIQTSIIYSLSLIICHLPYLI